MRKKFGPNEVVCKNCHDTFINEYRRGGDREHLEGLDSLGEVKAGAYRDDNVCNKCAEKLGTSHLKKTARSNQSIDPGTSLNCPERETI